MSSGASVIQETVPHTINVAVHVTFGTLALIAGFVPLLARKGGALHVRFGRYFLACLAVVILTAVVGIFAFGFRAFLGVITLLAAYEAYSGYRALKIRLTGPTGQDAIVSVAGLAATALFLVYLYSVQTRWAPVVIYSTLGTLVVVVTYDLARFTFPRRWFATTWLYEHLIKMIGAYTAVVSAFSGTIFGRWQPYSQMAPSLLGTVTIIGFVIYRRRNPRWLKEFGTQ